MITATAETNPKMARQFMDHFSVEVGAGEHLLALSSTMTLRPVLAALRQGLR